MFDTLTYASTLVLGALWGVAALGAALFLGETILRARSAVVRYGRRWDDQ